MTEKTKAEIEAENEFLKEKLLAAEEKNARMSESQGIVANGWLFTTNNPEFKGMVRGLQFNNGKAYLPYSKQNEVVAREIEADFGYACERVTSFAELSDIEKSKAVVDSVTKPPEQKKTIEESVLTPKVVKTEA